MKPASMITWTAMQIVCCSRDMSPFIHIEENESGISWELRLAPSCLHSKGCQPGKLLFKGYSFYKLSFYFFSLAECFFTRT